MNIIGDTHMNLTFEPIKEQDIETLTTIMKAAFDDDTRMHTDLQADGPKGYDNGSLIRRLLALENSVSERLYGTISKTNTPLFPNGFWKLRITPQEIIGSIKNAAFN